MQKSPTKKTETRLSAREDVDNATTQIEVAIGDIETQERKKDRDSRKKKDTEARLSTR